MAKAPRWLDGPPLPLAPVAVISASPTSCCNLGRHFAVGDTANPLFPTESFRQECDVVSPPATLNRDRMPAQDARANPRRARHCQAPDFGETGYRVACEWIRVVVATLVLEIGVLLVKVTSTLPSVDLEHVGENADSTNSQVTGPKGVDLERVGGGTRGNPMREIGTFDLWLAAS